MRVKIDRYIGNRAFGEVSSINGLEVSIYVYPEEYQNISIGNLVIINSGNYYPILIIHKNLHRARREQSFSFMKMGYEDLKAVYPDADTLYIYVISGVMIAYCDSSGRVFHGIGPSPRLHDLSYGMNVEDVKNIFVIDGEPNFGCLRYFIDVTNNTMLVREFFVKNKEAIMMLGPPKKVFRELFISLLESGLSEGIIRDIVKDFMDVIGGGDEGYR